MTTFLMILGTLFLIFLVLIFLISVSPIVSILLVVVVPAFFITGLFSGWETGFEMALAVGVGGFIGIMNSN